MSQDFNQKFCIECQEPHSYFNCPFVVCKNCGQKGHYAGKCPNPTLPNQVPNPLNSENFRRFISTERGIQNSAIIPSTSQISATSQNQDIIEVKEEFQEDINEIIPICDKKCRQMSKVCYNCKVYKAKGSTENLSAQSINQHFSAQFIIESVPQSILMIDIKEVGNRSRHVKVIECMTPLMPGNQIVVTFQVKKNLVVTSPSVLAETFLCHIPQKSGDETQHFSNKVGPKKVSKKSRSRSLSRPLSRSTRSRTRDSRSRTRDPSSNKDHSRTRDRSRTRNHSRSKDRSRTRDHSKTRNPSRTRNISQIKVQSNLALRNC